MGVLQIAGCALLSCMLLLCLRELRPSFTAPVRLAVTVVLTGAAFAMLSPVVTQMRALLNATDADEFATLLLRALGIALICELSASFCEDLGESAIAKGVSLFGKMEILILCLPLMERILGMAKELLQY